MRTSLFAVALTLSLSGTAIATTCVNDVCQQLFQKYGSAYCTLYKEISDSSGLPNWMGAWKDASISSACACITTSSAKSLSSTAKSSSKSSSASSLSSTCSATASTITSISTVTAAPSVVYSTVLSTIIPAASTVTAYSTVVSTIISLTTLLSTEIDTRTSVSTEIDVSTFASTEIDYLTTTVIPPTVTAYVTIPTTITAYSTSISVSVVSTCPTTSSSSSVVSSTTTGITSVPTSSISSTPVPCTATAYSMIAPAVAACTAITLQDISAPTNSTIVLTGLKAGTVVTFAGTTTFAFTNISTFDPITIGGAGITVQGAPGHVIEGNGAAYWDGIGSNGGVPKPNHFIAMSKVTKNSMIKNLYIKNYPVHCFSISGCSDVVMDNITLDNSAGNAPNAVSNGLPAGHNSDGFDISTSNNFVLQNSWVSNQDDCVAVTSGNNITIANMYCNGGHGMSIGSVGGKSNNNVTNITFRDSVILNSTNGPRIKTNYNTTGFISNVTYSNIAVSNIATYGIDIQEDYLNGGPTGTPTNGVIISNLLFSNVTGTAIAGAQDYYILCGDGSCSNFVFDNVAITGGTIAASCNYPATGCPGP